MVMPQVDILLATYNGGKYIEEQIASIQVQSHINWRLLVSDDCSDDDTVEQIECIAASDPRIKIVSKGIRYGGAKRNFMHLLSLSEAQYVMFCDQDDVWLPGKIEKCLERMKEKERAYGSEVPLLVLSDMVVVDSNLDQISDSFARYSNINPKRREFAHILAQAIGAGCTFLFNQKLSELALRCADEDQLVMHDWWLALVASAFGSIEYINEPLSLYRQHDQNEVGAQGFNVRAWLGNIGKMVASQERIALQAACFVNTFRGCGDENVLHIAEQCSSTCSGTSIQNIRHLFRSGSWKYGVRKIGQLLAVAYRGKNEGRPRKRSSINR